MKTARIKRHCFGGTKPGLVIYTCRRRGIRHYRSGLHPSLVAPYFYRADIAQLAALHKIYSVFKMLLAALPLPALHYTVIALLGSYHSRAFPYGIANGLFHIYILASLAGIYHDQRVPMVGCADYHRIDI